MQVLGNKEGERTKLFVVDINNCGWHDRMFWICIKTLQHLLPCTKMNSKLLQDLNIRHHQTCRREHRQTFSDINCTNVFLGQSPQAIEIKTKINQWDLIKLTSFAQQRKPLKKKNEKATYRRGGNSYKGLISKIHKQLVQLNSKKTKNKEQKTQLEKGQKT